MTLGADLALTRLFAADEWGAHDLHAEPSRRAGGRTPRLVDAPRGVTSAAEPSDLVTLSERANLAQALILRLLTPVGSLAELGHPDYGSRLGELVGGENTDVTRFLARRYVLEAVAKESRARIVGLDFGAGPGQRADAIAFTLAIVPVDPLDGGQPITLDFEVGL